MLSWMYGSEEDQECYNGISKACKVSYCKRTGHQLHHRPRTRFMSIVGPFVAGARSKVTDEGPDGIVKKVIED